MPLSHCLVTPFTSWSNCPWSETTSFLDHHLQAEGFCLFCLWIFSHFSVHPNSHSHLMKENSISQSELWTCQKLSLDHLESQRPCWSDCSRKRLPQSETEGFLRGSHARSCRANEIAVLTTFWVWSFLFVSERRTLQGYTWGRKWVNSKWNLWARGYNSHCRSSTIWWICRIGRLSSWARVIFSSCPQLIEKWQAQ